jgi:type IV pilus assembly protein PilW
MIMKTFARTQSGITFIEVLVSTVIALFAGLAIVQTFAMAEGYRRTGTSAGDASFSGALGIYLIDHDLGVAGYGINTATYLGCATTGADVSTGTTRNINFTLAPAQITPGINATTPDSITLVASGTALMPGPINLTTAQAAVTSPYVVTGAYGVTAGDVLLLAQAGQVCTLAQATNTPTAAVSNKNTIQHASGRYNDNGASYLARYNPSTSVGPTYGTSGVVVDMGSAPLVSTYYILNNTLMVDQLVSGQLAQPVAANIVQMKAIYGKDTNGDGIVDTWNTVAPVTTTDWANVLAVRIALVARSANPEKPNATTGVCSTTTTANAPSVTWDDGQVLNIDVSADPNWMCYRYKTFHITDSLRNLIWTPS